LIRHARSADRSLRERLDSLTRAANARTALQGLRRGAEWVEAQRALVYSQEHASSGSGCPLCSTCKGEMCAGLGSYRKFVCDGCRRHARCQRWHCGSCSRDICFLCVGALGTSWQDIGSQAPAAGTQVFNEALAAALRNQSVFTTLELEKLNAEGLSFDSYIKVKSLVTLAC